MRLLLVTREPHPTFRVDVSVLFGKYLPRLGVHTDLLAQRGECGPGGGAPWPGGRTLVCRRVSNALVNHVFAGAHQLRVLFGSRERYDAIQVRDKITAAAVALLAARFRGLPFFYWMSFPFPEGYAANLGGVGRSRGLLYYALGRLRVVASSWTLYRLVLPHADHVFVQSERMLDEMARRGVPRERMTAVAMGVDTERLRADPIRRTDDTRLDGRRVIVHLGVLARARQSDFLLDIVAALRHSHPDILLVLVGAPDPGESEWFEKRLRETATADHVLVTGWLDLREGLAYVKAAEVALSPIPPGFLFDVSSPTKVVEYLAAAVPVVANDIPDQEYVLRKSGAGVTVAFDRQSFVDAILRLLEHPVRTRAMGARGPGFLESERSYQVLAGRVAEAYRRLLSPGVPALQR